MSGFYFHDGAYHELAAGCASPPGALELPRLPGQWEAWDAAAGTFVLADGAVAALQAQVDAEAEAFRQRFITPGSGQAMTYLHKEAEAAAWLADNAAPTPFLTAEAEATGTSLAQLASSVAARAQAWVVIGPKIEAARIAAKQAISQASSAQAACSAAQVDWLAIVEA